MKYFLFILLTACFFSCKNKTNSTTPTSDSAAGAGGNHTATINQPQVLSKTELPASIKFKGVFHEGFSWSDKLGENILFTSLVPVYTSDAKRSDDGEAERSAELYAFHFIKKDTAWKLLWKLTDAEKDCLFDVTCSFLDQSTTITDLDHNGIAETKIQYKLACRSDVSPAYMKLVMHEDSTKYILRGSMWIKASDTDQFFVTEKDADLEKLPKKNDEYEQLLQTFGRYETEREFSTAPPAFLEYARKQWMQFAVETIN